MIGLSVKRVDPLVERGTGMPLDRAGNAGIEQEGL